MWPVTGCLDPAADNYASYAMQGVSTMCEYGGCNDTEASNFNPLATYNSGVCIYPKIGCTVRMRFAAFYFFIVCTHACAPLLFGAACMVLACIVQTLRAA